MKLHNKKTGETGYLQNDTLIKRLRVVNTNNDTVGEYNSLAELNEEWEDYDEPKIPYFINWFGEASELSGHLSNIEIEKLRGVGNYFETKEEAEKAVEKLKAWKRLEDSGVMFKGWGWDKGLGNYVVLGTKDADYVPDEIELNRRKDLDLLFGGEE